MPYNRTRSFARMHHGKSEYFETTQEVRQECILSPLLFIVVLNESIKEAKNQAMQYNVGSWNMEMIGISEIVYADDSVLMAKM